MGKGKLSKFADMQAYPHVFEYPYAAIANASFPLKGWGKTVTYHERLKESYYILQDYWAGLES